MWNSGKHKLVEFDTEKNESCNLKVNDALGMCVSSTGALYVYINGKYMGNPWNNLPSDKDFYGVIDLENCGSNSCFMMGKYSMLWHFILFHNVISGNKTMPTTWIGLYSFA